MASLATRITSIKLPAVVLFSRIAFKNKSHVFSWIENLTENARTFWIKVIDQPSPMVLEQGLFSGNFTETF